jgi:hypothetical protein
MVLTPEFVERLMDLDEGWTLVDDERALLALEMLSFLSKDAKLSEDSSSG